jgi:hypothetical protein
MKLLCVRKRKNSLPNINWWYFWTVDIFKNADKVLKRRRCDYANCVVSRFRNVGSCTTFWAMAGQGLAEEKAAGGAEDRCCSFRANEE